MTLANPSDPLKHQNVLLLAIIIGCVSEQIAGRRRAQLTKEEHIAFLCGEHVHFNCWGTMLLHTTHGLGLWHSGTVCPCTCNMACLFFYYYFLARLYNEQFNSSLSCFWVALTFFFFFFFSTGPFYNLRPTFLWRVDLASLGRKLQLIFLLHWATTWGKQLPTLPASAVNARYCMTKTHSLCTGNTFMVNPCYFETITMKTTVTFSLVLAWSWTLHRVPPLGTFFYWSCFV